jgi:hypothetical protein
MIAQAQGWPQYRERLSKLFAERGAAISSTAHKWVPEGTHDARSLVEFLEGSHSDRLEFAPWHANAGRRASDLDGFTERPSQTTTARLYPNF